MARKSASQVSIGFYVYSITQNKELRLVMQSQDQQHKNIFMSLLNAQVTGIEGLMFQDVSDDMIHTTVFSAYLTWVSRSLKRKSPTSFL